MTAPSPSRGFLVTFRPCGHVAHSLAAPEIGSWLTHFGVPGGCQSSREVVSAVQCPGCPDCPGWTAPVTAWRQPALFDLEAAA